MQKKRQKSKKTIKWKQLRDTEEDINKWTNIIHYEHMERTKKQKKKTNKKNKNNQIIIKWNK